MAKYAIPSQDETYIINDSNSIYTLAEDAVIATNAFPGGEAITESKDFSNNELVIDGTVNAGDFDGIVLNGQNTHVSLGETGSVRGYSAISFSYGGNPAGLAGGSVTNLGSIIGRDVGIYNEGARNVIDNFGLIRGGSIAINGWDYGVTVHNEKDGEIVSQSKALYFGAIDVSEVVKVVNEGLIRGEDAIVGDNNRDVIINRGTIKGSISLTGGDDVFDGRGGTTTGLITGGDGDDTFLVSEIGVRLKEYAKNGTDLVKSTVSHTLFNNFENLVLLGKDDIDGTGESHGNILQGNSGKNILNGEAGNDTLSGGKGADHFVFSDGFGKDEITDFSAKGSSHDVIDLSGATIKSFSDLKANHLSQSHGDAVIDLGSGDVLTIDQVSVADVNATHFVF